MKITRRQFGISAASALAGIVAFGTIPRPHGPRLDDPDWIDKPFPTDPDDEPLLGPNDGPFDIPPTPWPGPK